MAKLDVEIVETPPEIEAGKSYKIIETERVETELRGYDAIRLVCEEVPTGNPAGSMLWITKRTMKTTKLGTFLDVLGNDPDKWVGKVVDVVIWKDKERQVEVHK